MPEDAGASAPADAAAASDSSTCSPAPCASNSTFSFTVCACVATTPPSDASAASDSSTGFSDCPIPEPDCPPGTQFSVAGCECVAVADASTVITTDASTVSTSCSQLASTAQSQVSAAETQAASNLSCSQDSDCVLANNVTACTDGCGIILTQAGSAELQSAIAQINATTCATYTSNDCPPPTAIPCVAMIPYCTNGACSNIP